MAPSQHQPTVVAAMYLPSLAQDEFHHGLEEPQDPVVKKALSKTARLLHLDRRADVNEVPRETTPLLGAGKNAKAGSTAPTQPDSTAQIAKDETLALIQLSIPMMIAAFLEFLPETMLNMMAGHTASGTQALAAFNLSGLFQMMIVASVLNGLAAAIDTRCSQAFGLLLFLACLPLMCVVLLLGTPILTALGQNPTIANIAGTILSIMATALPFAVVFSAMKGGLISQNIVFPVVVCNLAAWVIGNSVAYVAAFPMGLGFVGVALAQPVSWCVKMLVFIPFVWRNDVFVDAWPGWQLRRALQLIPKTARLGASSILMVMCQVIGFSVISLLAGLLPNAAITISANGIFASLIALSSMPLFGICVAGSIRIGNALGAGDAKRAAVIARLLMFGCVFVSSLCVAALSFLARTYAHSFTSNAEVVATASGLIKHLWPLIPLVGCTFGLQGIFRACGKQLLCAQLNCLCLFVLGVPLGIALALKLHLGLAGLWYGNLIGLVVFITAAFGWLYRLNWSEMDVAVKKVIDAAVRLVHHDNVVVEVDTNAAHETTPLLKQPAATTTASASASASKLAAKHERTAEIAKTETWTLIQLSIPMMMAALLEFLPDTILTMMVGHTPGGTQNLAAFSLAGLFQMLIVMGLLNGIASAIDTLTSQAFGAKRYAEMWMFCQTGLLLYVAFLPFVWGSLLCGRPILVALGQDPAISTITANILVVVATAMPFALVFSVAKSGLQAQNIVFPFVLTNLVAWIVSNVAAIILAFPCKMGYVGVAMAIPISWGIKMVMLVPFVLRNKVFIDAWPGWQLREALALIPKMSKLGVSSVLMVMFQMLGFSTISLLAGLLPNADITISANGIFASLIALSSMPLFGICVAGAIRIGNALGAGDAKRAAIVARILLLASVIVSALGVGVLYYLAATFALSFTSDPAVISLATDLIQKLWVVIPLIGCTFGLQGVFRACGKQLLCAQFNFACMFVLGVPLGIAFALKFHLGLVGLWCGNLVGLVLFLGFGLVWFFRLDWTEMANEAKRNTHVESESRPAEAF
ncbi:TPA: hypothetical protein N0F65_004825 [Lagenidium giganteum]|uniref:Multidrug and toxic compound extrusion protein n=1 Tax=Lagenidium giganteum TaxID=4803 RepID=A0AAV2Z8G7_9STRA|nr:TPA: hypothetical protein N0F65_004825 [Lagenidium giganteum]